MSRWCGIESWSDCPSWLICVVCGLELWLHARPTYQMYQMSPASKLKGPHFLGTLGEGSRDLVGSVGAEAYCAEVGLAR